ncbi:ABC transporter ATP-binding protein [Streptosporangium saharense]|uniref:ABC transporter ATP-binding protein n=1 Tax=Streptosporangium saharense TaxID=1706840 RepID=UPI00367AC4BF
MTSTTEAQAAALTGGVHQEIITVEGAGKDYLALDGNVVRGLSPVDLTIERGAFVSLVGRSGCGKSTFLRLVAGLEKPTSGTIRIGTERVDGPPDSARYVFQNYNESLLPWRTVGDNIRFGLRHGHGAARASSKAQENELIQEHLEEVGLGGTFNRYPGELSGGMQQRVAIARALAALPELLLLDEPFSAVDALSRSTLQDLILRIWQEHGLTVLFVTHDIEEALYLSQRVIVLREKGGGVERDVTVDIPYPRRQVDFREDPRYLRLRREVLSLVLGTE